MSGAVYSLLYHREMESKGIGGDWVHPKADFMRASTASFKVCLPHSRCSGVLAGKRNHTAGEG